MNPISRCKSLVLVAASVFISLRVTIAQGEKVELIAGGGAGADGSKAAQARTDKPFAITLDHAGNLYIGEYEGCRVRKVDSKGTITTIGGTGEKGFAGDGGPAIKGQFNMIHDVTIGPDDNLYIADSSNRRVRKIDLKTGLLSTVAGNGGKASTGDGGQANQAGLEGVASLYFNTAGTTLYLAGFSKTIRAIDLKTSIISTLKDLPGGRSIALDSRDNLYIAAGPTLRVRTPDGKTRVLLDKTHLANSDLPLADNPKHLGIDSHDNLLICDEGHHLIRKYLVAEDRLVTLMGDGKPGTGGMDGPPDKAQLNRPHGICFNSTDGVIYIADSMNDRVVKIEP